MPEDVRRADPAPTGSPANSDEPWAIEELVGPYGVVSDPRPMDTRGWLPQAVSVYTATVGDLKPLRGAPVPQGLGGAGRTFKDPVLARRIAICEAVERYAMLFSRPVTPVVASGRELGARALPLQDVACCSSAELRRADGGFVRPDPDAKIRWTEGVELISGEPRFLPLMMAHMVPHRSRDELFWMPMSTGCAIHRAQATAVLAGLYEVVERDALAVAWLRRLPLPRLDPVLISDEVEELVAWYRDRDMAVHLFDMTTDIPIPSVLCVIESRHDRRAAQNVGTATGFDVRQTVLKAVLEASALKAVLSERVRIIRRYRDFADPMAAAAFMALPSRRRAFSFLLDGVVHRRLARPAGRAFDSPEAELAYALGLFRARGFAVYAVELTPREVEQVGYAVTQVIVPALQPATLQPLVQYRGHARLTHDHPVATGPQRIRDLNPWPVPMA
jgi:ribosomal protein S12 methylthiotransferase accessory factor